MYLDVTGIVGLVRLGILLLELSHVVGNMATEDVAAEGLSNQLLTLIVISDETVDGVGDVQSTIEGSLEGTEDLASGAGSSQTNIQETLEGTAVTIDGGDQVVLSVNVFVSLVLGVELELLQHTAGNQQTSGVG